MGLGGGAEDLGLSFLLRCAELLHAADFVKQLDYKVLQRGAGINVGQKNYFFKRFVQMSGIQIEQLGLQTD